MTDTSYIISGGFFDSVDSDRLYSADDMNMPYKDLVNDGIYKESDGTTPGFAVTASGSMNVLVAPGRALIGGKWGANKEIQTIEIAGNTGGTARIDSIVLQCDRNLDVRAVQIVYRQGGGLAPELLTSDGITEFRLANIRVGASASAISSGDITDTRGGTECPWVTSVFDPPDADYILTEYRTNLAGENRTVKAAIDSLQNAAQTGQPAVANQAADMRDTSLVYLYEGSEEGYDAGYLYHYSAVSDQWVRGAQYGASTVDTALSDSSTNAVQNRVVKAAVDQLTDDVAGLNERLGDLGQENVGPNKLNPSGIVVGNINTSGAIDSSVTTRYTSDYIPCSAGETMYFTCINSSNTFMGISAVVPLVVAFYDSNKDFIAGSRQTSVNSVTVPSGASYVRITGADGQIHSGTGSITFDTYPTKTAEFQPYKREFILYVQSQIDANTRRLTGDFDPLIVDCWGDSRTAMIASQGTSYCDYLQTLLGDSYNVCNYGESSQSSGMCAARLGSNEVFVTLTNNQIPANGEVQLTAIKCSKGNNRNLYAYSATSYIPCLLNGVRGRLSRASISDFSKVKFIRDSDGSAISVNPRTKIVVPDMGSRKHPCVLWWGKNDFSSAATYVVSGILANYAAAVDYIGHDHYVILGETCSVKESYEAGESDRIKLETINDELERLYPNNYIDINAWLSSEDALTSVGLTATATDLEYIAKGWPCYQLMKYSTDTSDDVHPNEKGREAIANRIYAWMQEKGW